MIIYSDIDEVLHEYRTAFYRELKILYDINIDNSLMPDEYDFGKILKEKFDLPEKEFYNLIDHINLIEEWIPTSFSKHIINFLKKREEKGDQIFFVTARTSRRGANYIIKEIFGKHMPIIQCDAQYKKYIINDKSIYFEDRGDTVESCSEKNKNSLIIVPEWPWNSYLRDKNLENVKVCKHDDFERILEEINENTN